jgi:hypothetical protein
MKARQLQEGLSNWRREGELPECSGMNLRQQGKPVAGTHNGSGLVCSASLCNRTRPLLHEPQFLWEARVTRCHEACYPRFPTKLILLLALPLGPNLRWFRSDLRYDYVPDVQADCFLNGICKRMTNSLPAAAKRFQGTSQAGDKAAESQPNFRQCAAAGQPRSAAAGVTLRMPGDVGIAFVTRSKEPVQSMQ